MTDSSAPATHSRHRHLLAVALVIAGGVGLLLRVSTDPAERAPVQPQGDVTPGSAASKRDTASTPPAPTASPAAPSTAPSAAAPDAPPASRPRLSPQEHAALARQIRARLQAAREAPSPPAPDQLGDVGTMRPEAIREVIRGEFIEPARRCYTQVLEESPEFSGKVVLNFTILADEALGGVVDEVTLGEDTDVARVQFTDCLREAMYETHFDAPEGGGMVTVTYPFAFAPG